MPRKQPPQESELALHERRQPIQVKQPHQVGHLDIDAFAAVRMPEHGMKPA